MVASVKDLKLALIVWPTSLQRKTAHLLRPSSIYSLASRLFYYKTLCSSVNAKFYPLGLDTHGGLGKPAREIITLLASLFARRRGTTSSTEYLRLVSTISSLTLQLTAHAVSRRSLDLATP